MSYEAFKSIMGSVGLLTFPVNVASNEQIKAVKEASFISRSIIDPLEDCLMIICCPFWTLFGFKQESHWGNGQAIMDKYLRAFSRNKMLL